MINLVSVNTLLNIISRLRSPYSVHYKTIDFPISLKNQLVVVRFEIIENHLGELEWALHGVHEV